MKDTTSRKLSFAVISAAVAMLVAICLAISGCSGGAVSEDATDYKDAFKKGNECYKNGEWEKAESYYRLADKKYAQEASSSSSSSSASSSSSKSSKSSSSLYSYQDAANNLGLALLQQNKKEKTDEAFNIFKDLMYDGSVESKKGYYLTNLLVASHMKGMSVKDLQNSADPNAESVYDIAKSLLSNEKTTGKLKETLVAGAVLYNMVNSDTRLLKDGKTSVDFIDYAKLFQEGAGTTLSVADNNNPEASTFLSVTKYIEQINSKRFKDTDDPDMDELKKYIEVLKKS